MVCLSNSDGSANGAAGVVIGGAISQGFCEALQRALTDGNGGL
jgi:membrane protease subunit (stomatin/prohibitin family)